MATAVFVQLVESVMATSRNPFNENNNRQLTTQLEFKRVTASTPTKSVNYFAGFVRLYNVIFIINSVVGSSDGIAIFFSRGSV